MTITSGIRASILGWLGLHGFHNYLTPWDSSRKHEFQQRVFDELAQHFHMSSFLGSPRQCPGIFHLLGFLLSMLDFFYACNSQKARMMELGFVEEAPVPTNIFNAESISKGEDLLVRRFIPMKFDGQPHKGSCGPLSFWEWFPSCFPSYPRFSRW